MKNKSILLFSIIFSISMVEVASAQSSSSTMSQAGCHAAKIPGVASSGAIANANSTKEVTGNGQPGTGGQFNSGGTTSGYNGIGSQTTANGSTTGGVATGQAPAPNCP